MALTMSTMMLLVPITSYAEQNTSMLEQPEGTISLVKTFNTTDESDNGRELFEDIYEKDGNNYLEKDNVTYILPNGNISGKNNQCVQTPKTGRIPQLYLEISDIPWYTIPSSPFLKTGENQCKITVI